MLLRMKKLTEYYGLALVVALSVSSCLDKDYSEHRDILDVPEKVSVPSDMLSGDAVTAELKVVSTSSWSASIDPSSSEWATLLTTSGVNLSGASLGLPLNLTFKDNESITETRSAVITVTTEKIKKTVTVTQEAVVPRIDVAQRAYFAVSSGYSSSGKETEELPVCYIFVKSNWYWKAAVRPDSNAAVTLDTNSGYRDGEIEVTFSRNADNYPKDAYVVLSSAGADDVVVIFHQNSKM